MSSNYNPADFGLCLPTRKGYTIAWFSKTEFQKNGKPKTKSFTSTSKEAVEAKQKELEEQGFEIKYPCSECMF